MTEQWLSTFRQVGDGGRLIAICSDEELLSASGDDFEDLPGVVTTRPETVAAAVEEPGRVTVVSTYASIPVVTAAHARHGLRPWRLMVCDEAHRTAGPAGKAWQQVHDEVVMPAERRLSMTATLRVFTGDGGQIVSMDDEKTYGPVVFQMTTGEAIARGLLANYQVLLAVCEPELLTRAEHLQVGRVALAPEVLAQQIAVLRAAREHRIAAMLTYHHRVAAAQSWANTLPQTWETMPDPLRPSSVWARYVHGEQDRSLRRAILRDLGRASIPAPDTAPDTNVGQTLRVVSNSRVLTEGVDVPAVDGIAMIDPRSSAVDIIQMIGRALRIGDRPGKVAKIVVPLLLSPDESAEAALAGSQYEQLWRVLLALRAQDERVEQWLDDTRAQIAEDALTAPEHRAGDGTAGTTPEWLRWTGAQVPAGFAEAVWLKAVRTTTSSWMDYYGAARAWYKAHGHIRVPADYRTPDKSLPLRRWLAEQFLHRHNSLSNHQQRLLAELGQYETPQQHAWRKGLAASDAWLATHPEGLHGVPRTWTHDRTNLADFLHQATVKRRTGRLSPGQDAELCGRDPDWYLNLTQRHLRAARAFYHEHGHLSPDPDYRTVGALDLSSWLDLCRNRRSAGALPEPLRDALERLGMRWSRVDARRIRGIIAARQHAREHGDLQIPVDHVCSDGYRLGAFLKSLQAPFRKQTLPLWVLCNINAIDPNWCKHALRLNRLALAQAYVDVHGHLPVPTGFGRPASPAPDGEDFRPWLKELRQLARCDTVSAQIQACLDALDAMDPKWRTRPQNTSNDS